MNNLIKKNFDYEYYRKKYPDIKQHCKTYEDCIWHFYGNNLDGDGIKEGRLFNKKLEELESYGYDKYIQENKLQSKSKFNVYIHYLDNYDNRKLKKEELNNNQSNKFIIYHICHNFGGGTFNYVNNLINILNNYKHIILYTQNLNKNNNIIICNNSIIFVHSFLYHDKNNLLNINYDIYNNIKYYTNKYLIIHDYFLIYPNIPNIINYKEPLEKNIKYLNEIVLNFKKVLFNTKFCYDFYNKYLNVNNNCIILNNVPDININNDTNYYLQKKQLYNVGIIGHINNEHKGCSLCHKIFKNNNKYKFIIFGNGNLFNNYSNVYVVGEYNNKNIFNLINYYKIDFFIFTSLFEETYSYTLSIELSTGLPIIYYDIGCIKERINNKNNCIPFKDHNIDLDNIIIKLIKNTNNINRSLNNYLLKNNLCEFNYYLNNEYYFNIKSEDIYNFKNVCFYHFCNINDGYNIFLEQMNKLKKTKLYDILDKIYISFLGKHVKLNLDSKMEIIYYSENINEMEFNIHKCIYKFCNLSNNNINILYFHSKGVLKKYNSENWRKYLEYFLIEKHEDCLKLLEENIDSIGVNANIFTKNSINKNRNHFSGNFWWSTSKYIKNLNFNLDKNDRYSVEHYIIGSNRTKNIISLHNFNKNLYYFRIEPYMYNLKIIKSKILNTSICLNKKKIIGLYFICAINSYKYRIDKQIELIINSKLYDSCFIILCYIIANNNDADYIKNKLKEYNKFILVITNNFNLKEKYLFNNYKNYLKYILKLNIENFNFFYIHNKGSSYNIENKPIDDWCDLNNYFTINKWNLNIKLLEYYDCVGINYKLYPLKHYSGNFWWTTGNHLKKLKDTIGDKYLDPEMYLMNNILINNNDNNIYMPNIISLYKSIHNHAKELYNKENYINLSDFDIIKNLNNIPFVNTGDNNLININNITFNQEL